MDLKIETKYLITSADEIEEILLNIRKINTDVAIITNRLNYLSGKYSGVTTSLSRIVKQLDDEYWIMKEMKDALHDIHTMYYECEGQIVQKEKRPNK